MLQTILLTIACITSAHAWALHCSDPLILSDQALKDISDVQMVANEKGDVAIAWMAQRSDDHEAVQIATRRGHSSWSPVQTISEWHEVIDENSIDIDAEGTIVNIWKISKDGHPHLFAVHQPAESSWSSTYEETFKVYPASDYTFQICSKNIIVYTAHPKDEWRTYELIAKRIGERDHEASTILTIPCFSEFVHTPWLFVSQQGRVLAVWEQSSMYPTQLKCAWYQEGKWSAIQSICSLPSGTSLLSFSMQAAFDDQQAILSFVSLQALAERSLEKIQVIIFSNNEWSRPIDLSPLCENVSNITIALNQKGDSLIAWDAKENKKTSLKCAYKPAEQEWNKDISLTPVLKNNRDSKL